MAFPIVMGTTEKIKDGDAFFQAVVNGTLWNKGNTWVRAGGYGMTWFYLYDNNVGFLYVSITGFRTPEKFTLKLLSLQWLCN